MNFTTMVQKATLMLSICLLSCLITSGVFAQVNTKAERGKTKVIKNKPIVNKDSLSFCESCCPPLDEVLLSELFDIVPLGSTLNSDYQIKWNANSYFANAWQQYTNYLRFCEPELKSLTVSLELIDAGTGVNPNPSGNSPACSGANFWATASPNGSGTTGNTNMFPCNLKTNHWYRVKAFIYSSPQNAFGRKCPIEFNVFVNVRVQSGLRTAQLSDGKKVLKTIKLSSTNK